MQLYKCDLCGKQIAMKEVELVSVSYRRTKEEAKELLKSNNLPINQFNINKMRKETIVGKTFDACKDCYNKFKKQYFEK